MTPGAGRRWLVTGGLFSAAAALLHLAAIVGGGDWYRAFGAGEAIARAAERGSPTPAIMTVGIATILGLWSLYAFSGAGLIRRLPLLRTALVAISAVYLVRAAMGLYPPSFGRSDLTPMFILWSSTIVLVYGLVHAIGTWRAWPMLSRKETA